MRKASRPPQSDIVFNSPIVLYTHKAVADGLVNGGLVTKDNSGAYRMDMAKAVDAMVANTTSPRRRIHGRLRAVPHRLDQSGEVELGNEYAALLPRC